MSIKYKTYIFGVFLKGKLIFQIGQNVKCSDLTAMVIVAILDMAKDCLLPDHYFAADFYKCDRKTGKMVKTW